MRSTAFPDKRRGHVALLLLGLCVGALYLLTFNRDFSVDGLAYAAAVDVGGPLLHSNHLLFNAAHYLALQGLAMLGLAPLRAIGWMQGVNVFLAVATVVAMARAAMPQAGVARATMLAALLSTSFAFWNFAQEPEAYLPPLCCVALSLMLLRDPTRSPSWRRVLLLAALAVAAVLLLQQYVFWYPALLLLLRARLAGDAARHAKWRTVLLSVPLLCLAAYLVIGAAIGAIDSPAALAHWLLGYGYDADAGLATYREAPALAVRFAGLLLGLGNLVFAYEVASGLHWMMLAAVAAALVAFALAPAWIATMRRRDVDALALGVFTLGNLGFAFWWESRNIEFLLPVGFGALMLAGCSGRSIRERPLAIGIALLLAINAGTAFWPQRELPARYRTIAALHAKEHLSGDDRVIAEELNTARWLGYFHRARVEFLPGAVSAAMHGDLALATARDALRDALTAGHRVYTMERDEHGRLRSLAERFALLGRRGYEGNVDAELESLYLGLRLAPVEGVPGVQRVHLPEDAKGNDAVPP
jgi:hypothetical protein